MEYMLHVGDFHIWLSKAFIPITPGVNQEALEISRFKDLDNGAKQREAFYMTTYYDIDGDGGKTFRWGCVWRFNYQANSYNGSDAGTLDVLEKASVFLSEFSSMPNLPVKLEMPFQKSLPI